MQTQAHFENITSYVLQELDNAMYSIRIAVPVLADPDIYEALCRKAQENVRVELILSSNRINTKSGLDYDVIRNHGASVVFVGSNRDKVQISNKYCVIDGEIVVTGSYSWSQPDQQKEESITIIREASDFASLFIAEFRDMLRRWERKADDKTIDQVQLVARLEALRGVIRADDKADIAQQLRKLKKLIAKKDETSEVQEIVTLVKNGNLDDAESRIISYFDRCKQVAVYVDTERAELKLELKSLEIQISAMENEKQEIDRTLHAYQYRHTIELGDLLRNILLLSKEILRREAEQNPEKEAEYEEAQREYEDFEEDFKVSSEDEVAAISADEQQEIKSMFRACTKLCHPDVVADEYKNDAAVVFHKLIKAYESNDMEMVREVYRDLQQGIFAAASDTLNDIQRMHRSLILMRSTLSKLSSEIRSLINSEVYREIAAIVDWDEYFVAVKQQLQDELDRLKGFDDGN